MWEVRTDHPARFRRALTFQVAVCLLTISGASVASAQPGSGVCSRTITADVVALDQAFFWNRLGVAQPQGMIFALLEDVVGLDGGTPSAGNARLRDGKRPRPIALRMNVGDCLEIHFQNFLNSTRVDNAQPATRTAGVHVVGMQLVNSITDDSTFIGANANSLVPPGGAGTCTLFAQREGTFYLYSSAATTGGEENAGQLAAGLFGAVHVEPAGAEWYRSQVSRADMDLATIGTTPAGHPIIDYDMLFPAGHPMAGRPIFKMLDAANKIRHSDLTAIITGPGRGNFPAGTYVPNAVYPNRDESFREFTIFYHGEFGAVQAFPEVFGDPVLGHTLTSVKDGFAINYGTGGIGAEILANRFGVGPMWNCTECKYEEFFLTSWTVGDPAMVVDVPANSNLGANGVPVSSGPQATKALYPDDPSNVYHSYLKDHVKFRLLHGGAKEHHIHHLHAHQWLYNPDSDKSAYLDSQAIGPGDGYTLEMVYEGSGNRNQTAGDSIFHCHFYPHFAQGMWGLWRVHDVFEQGTLLGADGRPVPGARALPDPEIVSGTPIPGVVPIPTKVMAPMPEADVDIVQIAGQPGGQVQITGTGNPGFPFFIPGVVGHRPPHPPMDTLHDGGLPRHVISGGTALSIESRLDMSKEIQTATAIQYPEGGTAAELAAMDFHAQRLHPSFLPDGSPGDFIANGMPPVPGAPFADPCMDDFGNPIGSMRTYKGANVQFDAILNKAGWHFPQARIVTLWDDVVPTIDGTRPPEPLFIRANTDDCVEYQHTNLYPNVYEMDDFQVRTPTDIIGQHIHLVKFDVMTSDGSANGWNYEDGTFAPDEVRERIEAIRAQNNCTPADPRNGSFECPEATAHPVLGAGPGGAWLGAQITVQRWLADTVLDNLGNDRTLRTVFTHDHYGPSTHQQAGLYCGLVAEPKNSIWRNPETGDVLGTRGDGGPTSFRADILTEDPANSYREFMLEFADYQLAYKAGNNGFPDPANAINASVPPDEPCPGGVPQPCPEGISTIGVGTMSVNYRNEPLDMRTFDPAAGDDALGEAGDISHVFRSMMRADPAQNVQPAVYPPLTADVGPTDPFTPLLRVYENDKVQIRTLVGSQEEMHNFTIQGLKWLHEPSWPDSGFRNSQMMGISEHFERLFTVPANDTPATQVDYLYMAGSSTRDLAAGIWGLMRAYDGDAGLRADLLPLPNNPEGRAPFANPQDFNGICPVSAPVRQFNVTATTAAQSLPGGVLTYNGRATGGGPIFDPAAMLYVRTEDLDANGQLLPGVPVEPLILRAAAGDCIEITLNNAIDVETYPFQNGGKPSETVGLHPQLLSYDMMSCNAENVGTNPVQTVLPGQSRTYRWYAGNIETRPDGTRVATPVEFGATNLMPVDHIEHTVKGLIGALIIEPQGSTWQEDPNSRASATVTKADGTIFRDFVLMFQDDVELQSAAGYDLSKFQSAVNYCTEPMWNRMGYDPANTTAQQTGLMDMTAACSNSMVGGDPVTPMFTAEVGTPVRFRLLFPGGAGTLNQVFQLNGHVWQRSPYINGSTELGFNPDSQWTGSQHVGPTSHFDLLLMNGAGGAFGVPGDYLYRTLAPDHFDAGIWGVFRVTEAPAASCASDADCDDGIFCNGIETCVNGICQSGPAPDCALLDIDADGDFDTADVDAFYLAVLGTPLAPEHVTHSDVNFDGLTDGMDIQVFLDAMMGF